MNIDKSKKPLFMRLSVGFIKWLGLALCVPVYMVIASALLAAALFVLFWPLDYLTELTDRWSWGTWGVCFDVIGYFLLLFYAGRWLLKRRAPDLFTQLKPDPLRATLQRETRVERWMQNGGTFALGGGFLFLLAIATAYGPAFGSLLQPLDKWVDAVGASIFTWFDSCVGGIIGTGWGPWILAIAPFVAIYAAGSAFPRYFRRHLDFFTYAIGFWILSIVLFTFLSSVICWIVFFALVVAGAMIGSELGWIAALLKNGWEDRQAQAKGTDSNSD